jgi:tripartite-type tricarboxylate transporter receptor subunit TctC
MNHIAISSACSAIAALLAATFSLLPTVTHAQDYPSQDIRLICGFPPGSGADIFVRYFAEKLRPIAGRTVVVENKVGAASNIATEYVARAKPDGYTLYPFTATTVASSMYLFKNPPVDVGKALRVAATLSTLAFTLVVDASAPYKSVAELTRR